MCATPHLSSECLAPASQADCDYYHRVRSAGLSVHGCYAGRVYDMAVVAPGLPEGPDYDRDAALAVLVRPLTIAVNFLDLHSKCQFRRRGWTESEQVGHVDVGHLVSVTLL